MRLTRPLGWRAPRALPAAKRVRVVAKVLSSPPKTVTRAPKESGEGAAGLLDSLKNWRWGPLSPEPAPADVQQVQQVSLGLGRRVRLPCT